MSNASIASERERTNIGLRTEREKTDQALFDKLEAGYEGAALVVQNARENADAVLDNARDALDERRKERPEESGEDAEIAKERLVQDKILREERAAQDEALRRAREENARMLARLLPFEREKTDRYLLTERERADDALANRDEFLGIVSHDLRNLLGGIVMGAGLIAERGSGADDPIVIEAKRIHRYAARMNRLIGDLVDVASIDAGNLAVTPAPMDLGAVITEALELFEAVAAAKGVSLRAELSAGPLKGTFDHDRILQVVANLVSNAIKFTPPGGAVVVRAEREDAALRASVSDTGCGIPESKLEQIFERFWQAKKGDRRGVGLGLYISRCLVEAHGGTIWAASKLGAGTRVSFRLPQPAA